MNIITENVKTKYSKKRHRFRSFSKYSMQKSFKKDGAWYKVIANFINNIFNDKRNQNIRMQTHLKRIYAEKIMDSIFSLDIIPHTDNILSKTTEPPYNTFVEVNVSEDRYKTFENIRLGLMLHQLIRKMNHKMHLITDEELLRDDNLLHIIKFHNHKVCRYVNKVPKLPKIFVKRDKNDKITKFIFA